MAVILETNRLLIREFTMKDVEDSYQMNLDPEVTKYTNDGGVQSRDEIHHRIKNHVLRDYKKYGYGRWAVEFKPDNKFIGFCGLKFISELNEVEVGYRFMRDYWGLGIATESAAPVVSFGFEQLDLERIIGLVMPGNIASIRVLEKLGFSYEKNIVEDGESIQCYSKTK